MKEKFSVLIARACAREPYKSYGQLCAMLAKRPRRKVEAIQLREIRLPYKD